MYAMPAVYNKILSSFALGLGYPEDFFFAVMWPTPTLLLHDILCAVSCVHTLSASAQSCIAE